MVTHQQSALRERIRQAITTQPQSFSTILSSLLAVQDALGWLPEEAIEEVAAHSGGTVNDVWAVASFYTNFRFTPPGRHVVEVCWGPTCHLKGAQAILDEVQRALGLEHEGDTSDGGVSLKYNTCLGACSQGPVIMVDHAIMGNMTSAHAHEAVARLDKSDGNHASQHGA
ncbi:MAG: NAD(P)H-dependent oxidoreductase subunit E [Chloroflexi bacterium]|nr:NAD(P)H-dependent oxidoreductase subunit E [Chloroflexota bacterium]